MFEIKTTLTILFLILFGLIIKDIWNIHEEQKQVKIMIQTYNSDDYLSIPSFIEECAKLQYDFNKELLLDEMLLFYNNVNNTINTNHYILTHHEIYNITSCFHEEKYKLIILNKLFKPNNFQFQSFNLGIITEIVNLFKQNSNKIKIIEIFYPNLPNLNGSIQIQNESINEILILINNFNKNIDDNSKEQVLTIMISKKIQNYIYDTSYMQMEDVSILIELLKLITSSS